MKGGFFFHPSDEDLSPGTPVDHPSDEDLSPGTPVDHPSDEDLSPGTPERKKPLERVLSVYTNSENALFVPRFRPGASLARPGS